MGPVYIGSILDCNITAFLENIQLLFNLRHTQIHIDTSLVLFCPFLILLEIHTAVLILKEKKYDILWKYQGETN